MTKIAAVAGTSVVWKWKSRTVEEQWASCGWIEPWWTWDRSRLTPCQCACHLSKIITSFIRLTLFTFRWAPLEQDGAPHLCCGISDVHLYDYLSCSLCNTQTEVSSKTRLCHRRVQWLCYRLTTRLWRQSQSSRKLCQAITIQCAVNVIYVL